MTEGQLAAQLQQAIAHHQRGHLAEAEQLYQAILSRDPNNFDALQLLGLIASQCGAYNAAIDLIGRALAIKPIHAVAQHNRGVAFMGLGRLDEALGCLEKAVAIRPDYADALLNRGSVLYQLGWLDAALMSYNRALAVAKGNAFALANKSVVLLDLDRPEEALAAADQALKAQPDNPDTLYNRGNALRMLKRLDEANAAYDRAIALRPDYPNAHLNAAMSHLAGGDFARGWEEYEWRWRTPQHAGTERNFTAPQWNGEDVRGKTLLIHAEQGLGDAIQFSRYAALAAECGARVVLEVHETLKVLLRPLAGVSEIIARGETLPAFDVHCPMLSLPRAFKTTVETIPAQVPYLTPDPGVVSSWQSRLPEGRRVGVVWRGNPKFGNDRKRSLEVAKLSPLLASGASLVSLQKEIAAGDEQWLAANNVVHFGNELRDFTDTAALASLMDAVVSVDTSVAHLAGALGKKTWILLPHRNADWRWMLDREDSPWYPTARLLRQPTVGDWDSVIARVARELAA